VSDALTLHLSCKVIKYYDISYLCATELTILNILGLSLVHYRRIYIIKIFEHA